MNKIAAQDLWLNMHEQRKAIIDSIDEMKYQINYADGERRIELKEQIARIGEAIEYARSHSASEPIDPVLVKAIQFANRERADNRREVKLLASRMLRLKQSLKKMNRFLSEVEGNFR